MLFIIFCLPCQKEDLVNLMCALHLQPWGMMESRKVKGKTNSFTSHRDFFVKPNGLFLQSRWFHKNLFVFAAYGLHELNCGILLYSSFRQLNVCSFLRPALLQMITDRWQESFIFVEKSFHSFFPPDALSYKLSLVIKSDRQSNII